MVELAWMDQPSQYMVPPARFEAGTQPVAQVVAAGVAAEWMMNVGLENIEAHERTIAAELLKMGDIDGVRILGPRENVNRIGTVAFDVAAYTRMTSAVHRRARHRHPRRPSLRPAGAPPLRSVCVEPRILRRVQQRRRRSRPGRGRGEGSSVLRTVIRVAFTPFAYDSHGILSRHVA